MGGRFDWPMLVLHANWSDGALRLWAESLEGYLTRPVPADAQGRTAAPAATASPPAPGAPATRHPFAASPDALASALVHAGRLDPQTPTRPASLHLRLPADPAGPRPSDRLSGAVGAVEGPVEPHLGRFEVPGLSIGGEYALAAGLLLEDRGPSELIEYGHSVRYWLAVVRFAWELLVDQRFIPTLLRRRDGDLAAAWQPWLHDEATRARVGALLAAMPPVTRAVDDAHEGRPWLILDEALRTLTDQTIRGILRAEDFAEAIADRDAASDPHVAWLTGLLAQDSRVTTTAEMGTALYRDIARWVGHLDETGRGQPFGLRLRLQEPPVSDAAGPPPSADGVRWRLSLHLLSADDPSLIIDAEEVWRQPPASRMVGGHHIDHPQELLLSELGRASRVYPKLETMLSQTAPWGLELTTAEAYAFLGEYRPLLEESGFAVSVPEWWGKPVSRIGARLHIDSAALESDSGGPASSRPNRLGLESLVGCGWRVAIGDQTLSGEEFERLSASDGPLVFLHGRWVEIRPDDITAAAALLQSDSTVQMPLREALQMAQGKPGEQPGLPVFGTDATGWVGDMLGASADDRRMPMLEQPTGFVGTLRPYQKAGLSWMAFLDSFGLGACLADDMGLGKTIQLIALLLHERQDQPPGAVGPTLLVVPTSLVSNWSRELDRFGPSLTYHIHHGPDRPMGDRFVELADRHDLVITTYALVSRDRETLGRVPWYRVALDEAQFIKNPPTQQSVAIRGLRTQRRLGLTGTPVENRLHELWSIMEFCNPGYLGQSAEFRRRFAVPIERYRDQHQAQRLRELVGPFILRRLKSDPNVISDLPACVQTKEYATLTSEQAALYQGIVNSMLGQVGRAGGIQRRGLVLTMLLKLKQLCNHPALFLKEPVQAATLVGSGRAAAPPLSARSGKSRRLMEMLDEVLATGDQALIFTQFRQMGHLLTAMIHQSFDCNVLFLHGQTPLVKRQQMIDRFQAADGATPIFVLSLKAGGIGLNLTAANHVFHFDRWWNPAVENQATDRAYRIGQQRTVHVHKFVCLGTLEERIDQMIEQKVNLAENVVGSGEHWLTELSTGQLRDLLALRDSALETVS